MKAAYLVVARKQKEEVTKGPGGDAVSKVMPHGLLSSPFPIISQ